MLWFEIAFTKVQIELIAIRLRILTSIWHKIKFFLGGLNGHIGDIIKVHVRDQLLINTYVSSGNDSHRSGKE